MILINDNNNEKWQWYFQKKYIYKNYCRDPYDNKIYVHLNILLIKFNLLGGRLEQIKISNTDLNNVIYTRIDTFRMHKKTYFFVDLFYFAFHWNIPPPLSPQYNPIKACVYKQIIFLYRYIYPYTHIYIHFRIHMNSFVFIYI